FLLTLCLHLIGYAWRARGRRRDAAAGAPARHPVVTVQLPIRNEGALAARVMRAAFALDWPRDRLEIQVLDDSDDDTSLLIDRTARELGDPITVLRRRDRRGGKGGNLRHGLAQARGELVCVFDADFVPPSTFLRDAVPRCSQIRAPAWCR